MRKLFAIDRKTGKQHELEVSDEEADALVTRQFDSLVRQTVVQIGSASGIDLRVAADIVSKLGDEMQVAALEEAGKLPPDHKPPRSYGHYV